MVWVSGKPTRCLNPQCEASAGFLVVNKETAVHGVIVGDAVCSVCAAVSRYTRRPDPAPRKKAR